MADRTYRIGDVEISELIIYSERGSTRLLNSLVSMSIYESIFTPGMVCDIKVIDMNDQLGQLRFVGDELVYLEMYVLGSQRAVYNFALHNLSGLENVGAQKGKMYMLQCVSEEAMYAKTNFVQKSYNQLCSEMVEDIHTAYLKSTKPIIVEPTSAPQRIIIPHKNPYQAIDLIKRRSVSAENDASLYMFFENRTNEQQTFNFVTIEKMFTGEPVKDFQMSDAININSLARGDDNIIAFRIPDQFNSTDRIAHGGPRRVTTFNFTTWEFANQNIQTNDASYIDGGSGTMNSATFRSRYFNADIPPQALIPVDISQRPTTFIPEATPDLQAYTASMLQNSIRIKVIGDTILTAGVMINCQLPNKQSFTSPPTEDLLITGKFLITRIHHRISEVVDRPRYTCVIEAVKGRYEEGV